MSKKKEVKMKMQLEVLMKNPVPKDNFFCDIGGFEFRINGVGIPFDFNAFSGNYTVQGNSIIVDYESGEGLSFKEFDISEDFEERYNDLGLTTDDITAKFLSEVEIIDEFYVQPGMREYTSEVEKTMNLGLGGELPMVDYIMTVKSISFYDESDTEYPVPPQVIESLNADEINSKVHAQPLLLDQLMNYECKNEYVLSLNHSWVKGENGQFCQFFEYYGELCGEEKGLLPEESLDALFSMSKIEIKDGSSINNFTLMQQKKRYQINLAFEKAGSGGKAYFDFNSITLIPGPQHRINWGKNEQFVAIGHVIGEMEKENCENLQDLDYMDMAEFAEEVIREYDSFLYQDKPDFIEFVTGKVQKLNEDMENEAEKNL